jgi:hypothetical protein
MNANGRRRRARAYKLHRQEANSCATGDPGIEASRDKKIAFCPRDHRFQ